jgi:DNA-directed RNA polymerase specialized sigma subunit
MSMAHETAGVSTTLDPGPETAPAKARRSSLSHGKRDPLTPEQSQLAGEQWGLACRVARRFSRRCPGVQIDWEGAAALGVCRAAATYREDRGTTVETHVHNKVIWACIDLMRDQGVRGYGRHHRYEGVPEILSFDRPVLSGYDSGRDALFGDLATPVADEPPVGWELEWEDEIGALTRGLPGRQGQAIRLYYLHAETKTMRKAGAALGLSESRVSQIHADWTVRLREGRSAC